MEGAKIYAQNAIRKKSEALNYLQLASRLDAVVSRLNSQAKQQVINKSMVGIVRSLSVALKNAPLDKMMTVSARCSPSTPRSLRPVGLLRLQ